MFSARSHRLPASLSLQHISIHLFVTFIFVPPGSCFGNLVIQNRLARPFLHLFGRARLSLCAHPCSGFLTELSPPRVACYGFAQDVCGFHSFSFSIYHPSALRLPTFKDSFLNRVRPSFTPSVPSTFVVVPCRLAPAKLLALFGFGTFPCFLRPPIFEYAN